MRIFTKNSRFSYGILMVLLIVCTLCTFIIFHNQLSAAQGKTHWLAVALTFITIVIAIILLQLYLATIAKYKQSTLQLEQLKISIQQSKSQAEEVNLRLKKETYSEKEIDFTAEAKSLIPSESIEDEGLFLEKVLSNIAKKYDIVQAVAFLANPETRIFSIKASFAYFSENEPPVFTVGETLPGQVAKNRVALNLNEIPEDYITILSGLGKGSPSHLLLFPLLAPDNNCIGVIELASFKAIEAEKVKLFETLGHLISEHLSIIGKRLKE